MSADDSANPDKLLALARKHQGEHLGALLDLYRNYLRLLAQTQIDLHLQGRVDPSDLVQETMLEAFRDFGQFRGETEAQLLAWLRRILLHNLARIVEKQLHARKRDVRREVSLDRLVANMEQSSNRIDAALVSQATSMSSHLRQRERAIVLADQLARLKPDYRNVLVLRNLEGRSFEDIAGCMGRSAGAVRMLWLRALDRLKQLLTEEDLI
jgi:RNA polymerase sigma-70 factor (ECF subfamily)